MLGGFRPPFWYIVLGFLSHNRWSGVSVGAGSPLVALASSKILARLHLILGGLVRSLWIRMGVGTGLAFGTFAFGEVLAKRCFALVLDLLLRRCGWRSLGALLGSRRFGLAESASLVLEVDITHPLDTHLATHRGRRDSGFRGVTV